MSDPRKEARGAAEAEPGAGARRRAVALPGLFALGVFYTLHFAREVLLPITIAVLLSFVLRPIVAGLGRVRLREPIAAALVLAVLFGGTGVVILRLGAPAAQWLVDSEATALKLARRIQELVRPVQRVGRAAEHVSEAASATGPGGSPQVELRSASFAESLLSRTRDVAAATAVVLMLLLFLLASDERFLHRVIQLVLNVKEEASAAAIARDTTRRISAYLFAVVLLNTAFGLLVTIAMALIGMPNPALWGVMAALLEFIPYLGALTGTMVVAMAGMVVFEGSSRALVPPAVYIAMASLQGGVVVPLVLGRMLTLHPVAVVVSLVLWGWLWGIPVTFLAIPLLATLKIVCDRSESLAALGRILGDGRRETEA